MVRNGAIFAIQVFYPHHAASFIEKIISGQIVIDTRYLALWQTLLFLIGIIFLNKKISKRLIFGVSGLVFIYLFNVIRIELFTLSFDNPSSININIINGLLVLLLNFLLFMFFVYWWKQNYPLKKMLLSKLKIQSFSLRKLIKNLFLVFLLLITINFLAFTQIVPLISWISTGVLYASQYLLRIFGYTVYVYGRYLYTPNAAIFFSDSCAGIELMFIYSSFIAILNGRYKFWFIFGGILIIFLMNIIRISLIMKYLIHNNGHYGLSLDLHDIYTYPVYLVIFILWVIWIHYFSDTKKIS
jgi:exosortase/archaeosortase family protein